MTQSSLRMGLFTGAFFAGAGVAQAFLPLWLTDHGVTAAQLGAILGVAAIVRLVAVPGWGWLADRMATRRPILAAAAALTAVAAICFPLGNGVAAFATLITLQSMAAAALSPLTDAVTMALALEGRLIYGRVRAWGSASYMLATAAAGPILAWASSSVVPGLIATGYAAAAALAALVPEPARPLHVAEPGRNGLLRMPGFRMTVLASALIQGSHAAYYAFAPILWRSAGLGDTAIGLLIAEGIVMEIVLFIWGGAWAARMGPARLTAMAACACVVRWTAIGATASVPVLMVVQLLHAGTFAMQHLSAMTMLGRVVLPRRAAGAQALHAAMGFSAPTGLLIWVSGLLYAQIGGGVFFVMAGLGAMGLATVAPLARSARTHSRATAH